jgi:hypothetical protein
MRDLVFQGFQDRLAWPEKKYYASKDQSENEVVQPNMKANARAVCERLWNRKLSSLLIISSI